MLAPVLSWKPLFQQFATTERHHQSVIKYDSDSSATLDPAQSVSGTKGKAGGITYLLGVPPDDTSVWKDSRCSDRMRPEAFDDLLMHGNEQGFR